MPQSIDFPFIYCPFIRGIFHGFSDAQDTVIESLGI